MKYTKDHEWVNVNNDVATVGITTYAAEALGELVYVELPEVGTNLAKGDAFAVVESSKSASDVYAPISGEIVEVNSNLDSEPELVNNSTYENGWIIKIKFNNEAELDETLDEAAYQELLANS